MRLLIPTLLAACSTTAFAAAQSTAEWRVNRADDHYDGVCNAVDCSLRDAISAANAGKGPQRILLPAGTYVLTLPADVGEEGEVLDEDANLNGDLDVSGNVTIFGAGVGRTLIRGSDSAHDRLFEVLAGASLRLEGLSLEKGHTSFYGGALENHGNAYLRLVDLTGNTGSAAFDPGAGGALANFGHMEVDQARFKGNRSSAGEAHFGQGGAIYNAGDLRVRDSRFDDNTASDDDDMGLGGAIYNRGKLEVARTSFVGNRVSVNGSGSAIANDNGATLTLSNSTLSGNFGDALSNGLRYSGRAGVAQATVINVTVAANEGFGVRNRGTLSLRNSLLASNHDESGETVQNCLNEGTYHYSAKGLLLGAGAGNCTGEVNIEDSKTFVSVLFPLAENGAFSPTHALRPRSPAIDAAIGNCPVQDQRASMRPRDGDGDGVAVCDLGAYERTKP
ncbi:CSLREA domain-containing protein [Pseudomonas mangiferae]|nr:CSLREA domain-containing protein [Pseudomonas mangiferae]